MNAWRRCWRNSTLSEALFALAEREGCVVTLPDGSKRLNWSKLMAPRRGFDKPVTGADYFTQEEATLLWKYHRESLVTMKALAKNLQIDFGAILNFVVSKKIPVYEVVRGRPAVWTGDVVRAIQSTRLDLEADGGLWRIYLRRQEAARQNALIRARRKGRKAHRRQDAL